MNRIVPWVIAGVVVAGGVTWLLLNKPALPKKPAAAAPGPPAPPGPDPVSIGPSSSPASPNNVPGSNVYSKAGLTIRSSPKISNGFLGWGDNSLLTVSATGTFVGNIVDSTLDSNSDADSSGNIYTWYKINPSPALGMPTQGSFFVREDYITVK